MRGLFETLGSVTVFWCGVFNATFKLLPWTEGHYATRSNGNIFSRFWVSARTLVFVTQVKITKPRQFNLFSIFQRAANLFEKQLHQLFCVTFAQPEFLKQVF
ncbi:Hypothetical Protein PANA_1701 [Pantoea ananatis LMG 20103]|uniref:Uncharacterized protein n=1 Tax=Pantoea ananatis (strain LMG 20103) TaxID=706191 RepID=D4GDI1_PANAM|nr:Hypothetical Protein PANA_1701 [Pantoea ananatis LMG 20103]